MFSARTEASVCILLPLPLHHSHPKLQSSGVKTSLSEDQEALGWGAWLGYDRAGAPVPSPTRE